MLLRCAPHVGVRVEAADLVSVRRVSSGAVTRAGAVDGVLNPPVGGRTDVRIGLRAPATARLPLGPTAQVTEVRATADDVASMVRGLRALIREEPGVRR